MTERDLQDALIVHLTQPDLGWRYASRDADVIARLAAQGVAVAACDPILDRHFEEVLIEPVLIEALTRLNPEIAAAPSRVDQVLPQLRALVLAAGDDGLVATNERMTSWLRGHGAVKYIGEASHLPVRLIDLEHPRANDLVVTDEVVYPRDKGGRRYDLVLWVNGIPLVVIETKSPTGSVSWLNGAEDIHDAYEVKTPNFFVPNLLSVATEGKELRYGAVRQPAEMWLPWSRTTDAIPEQGLASVLDSAALLLSPENLLSILRTYVFYSRASSTRGAMVKKVIPRYPQVEAVEAIVARVRDGKRKGLIWHHQGSGKTLLMAFAAAEVRRQEDLDAPTTLVVLDRLDLIEQVSAEFKSIGLPALQVAETSKELQKMLADDQRGIIVTTIFRFADAGLLNERENIVVLVDEAHRTQEGRLGRDMREALPNATFIGLTGTPVSTADRNTWETFGCEDDPHGVLNHYSVERSIADGATLPIHMESRLVDYQIDHDALNQAFKELAEDSGLDEREAGMLARRASRVDALIKDQDRSDAVCRDIVAHYIAKVRPLGLKAQVVAFDRELCVRYRNLIQKELGASGEVEVVMTAVKDDPVEWDRFNRTREEEARIKDRFNDPDDPLQILVVTAKLLTGFDAPIEGVMYLDKPLKAHTLFQAVTRTNRRWTNPSTGQEKLFGLVVDYVGLGKELAKAVSVKNAGGRQALPEDVAELAAVLKLRLDLCRQRFGDVDRSAAGFAQLMAAQAKLPDEAARDEFAAEFISCEALFEFLWPDTVLRPLQADYRWLAKVYKSVVPADVSDALVWKRLGAKTMDLISQHVGITLDDVGAQTVVLDSDAVDVLRQLSLVPDDEDEGDDGDGSVTMTTEEILDGIAERIRRRMERGGSGTVWPDLAARLEALRSRQVANAAESMKLLADALKLAREVVEADNAIADTDDESLVDKDRGALTAILEEFAPDDTPVIVERVAEDIDAIVRPVRGTGWQASHPGDRQVRVEVRKVLRNHGLPASGELFDRAYAYIAEHY